METTKIYQYQQVSVAYDRLGMENDKPLLILHGWGSNKQVMHPLAEQLADIRECYVLDLPGFGNSSVPPTAWNLDDYAHFARQFINDLELQAADLLVHSFGGRIALKLCAEEGSAELADKLLITGGAGMKPKRSFSYYLKKYTAKILKAPFLLLPAGPQDKALQKLRQTSLWKALGSSDYSKLDGVMREVFVQTVTEYLEPCLPHISQETLLLWGRDDKAVPSYQAERMEAGMENAALVTIENAGHYAFLDRPSHFTSIARAFLEGEK